MTPFLDGYINHQELVNFLTICLVACLCGAYYVVATEVTDEPRPLWFTAGLTTGFITLVSALLLLLLEYNL